MGLTAGARLGRYEIVAPVGSGGMGKVFRARDTRLERDVAIKVLSRRLASDPTALARFDREARAVAAVSHPNVLAIYDVGNEQGIAFVVTELLEGETLRAALTRQELTPQERLEIALAVVEGLAAAHGRGVVHRDLKPENIFLTKDRVAKLLDFGLARLESGADTDDAPPYSQTATTETQVTLAGTVMGTAAYMSPEQAKGESADSRSDLFSLGSVLFEMFRGETPFGRPSLAETMAAILREDPPAMGADDGLEQVVRRCLHKQPAHRFQSARDIVLALRDLTRDRGGPTMVHGAAQSSGQGETASVAVLPLVNMSADPENEYFGDGLAEELIHTLCKIDGLQVASRTSTFAFKGKSQDIRQIAEQLGVQTLVEGSVRRAGDRLRVAAQLINAADGYHLWSETYDRPLDDLFAVQDEIAGSIASALRIALTDKERRAIAQTGTNNARAYDYCLRGRQLVHEFRRESVEQALKLFQRASDLDPGYAVAHAGVADCCSMLYAYFVHAPENLTDADQASMRAVECDVDCAEAHVSRGIVLSLKQEYGTARAEFEMAMALNPSLYEAYYFYGRTRFAQEDYGTAAKWLQRAMDVNPDDFQAACLLSRLYHQVGREDDSRAASERTLHNARRHLELFPADTRALGMGAIVAARLGESDQALGWSRRALDADPEEAFTQYNAACVYSLLGEFESAVECLEASMALGAWRRAWVRNDSDLDALRQHPGFLTLLEGMEEGSEI